MAQVIGIVVGDGAELSVPVVPWVSRWTVSPASELLGLLTELALQAPTEWVLCLPANCTVENLDRLALALEAVEANEVVLQGPLAAQTIWTAADGSVAVEPTAVLWPLGGEAAGTAGPLSLVEGVRVHRQGAPEGGGAALTVALPDPVEVATRLRADPLQPGGWLELHDVATSGLALVADAVANGYPSDASADVLMRLAQTLRRLASADLLRPSRQVFDLADRISGEASAAARTPAFTADPTAVVNPADPTAPAAAALPMTSLDTALQGACFVLLESHDLWLCGIARDLQAAGMTAVGAEQSEILLALAHPVLFLGFDARVADWGQRHPGLVHVLWSDESGSSGWERHGLDRVLAAAQEHHVRLWWTRSAPRPEGTTALSVAWRPVGCPEVAEPGVMARTAEDALEFADAGVDRCYFFGEPGPGLTQAVRAVCPGMVLVPVTTEEAWLTRRWHEQRCTEHPDCPGVREHEETHPQIRRALGAAGFAFTQPRPPRQHWRAPRVVLLADERGWSFDAGNAGIAKILTDEGTEVARWYRGDPFPRYADAYYCPWRPDEIAWRLPPEQLLGALRTHRFDAAGYGAPEAADLAWLRRCVGFAVANRASLAELRAWGADDRVVYLPNPVDMARFPEPTRVSTLVAEWNGTTAHRGDPTGDAKGLALLQRACEQAGVPLRVAEYHASRLPPSAMPAFYREASVALCASTLEGSPNSVLEAMASGLALITTDCGNARELRDSQLQHCGESGVIIVGRSTDSFVDALRQLSPASVARMGEVNRQEVTARWSWEFWRRPYLDFFARVLQ